MDLRDIQQLLIAGQITDSIGEGDFIVIGRPNPQRGDKYSMLVIKKEDLGLYITPYKEYLVLVSQSGTNNPTSVELINTLGEITLERIAVGTYRLKSNGLFREHKTALSIVAPDVSYFFAIDWVDESNIEIQTGNGTHDDNLLQETTIGIKVF